MAKESWRRRSTNKEIKLFGVKINVVPAAGEDDNNAGKKTEDESLRKCKSMGSLGACMVDDNIINDVDHRDCGYLSDGLIHQSSDAKIISHDCRKGKPWSEEEHRSFLFGLEKLGKGDWKGISKNFVRSRTPTQVASHAQKYFLRSTATERKKRRSSVFDIPLNEMDASSPTSPTSISRSPEAKMTLAVKAYENPPLAPMAPTSHAVSDLLGRQMMVGLGAPNFRHGFPSTTAMPNVQPVLPMWSFSNQKFVTPPNMTAIYSSFPSVAQQTGGIFSVIPAFIPSRVTTANESPNRTALI